MVDYDSTRGILTFSDSRTTFDATFTLDYDAFDALTGNTALIYINTTRANDSSKNSWGLFATGDATVTGYKDPGSDGTGETHAGSTVMRPEDLLKHVTTTDEGRTIANLNAVIDSKKTSGTNYGTNLFTSDGETVYKEGGLRYTEANIDTAYVNNDLITTLTIFDYNGTTFSNSKGTWSKVFAVDKVTNVTTGRTDLLSGHTNVNPIVVGGTGQLFLQSWKQGGNPNALNVSSDIYLGSTSYTEANSGAAYNNVALRFGNDATRAGDGGGNITNVTGNIYVVEDAMMKSGSTNAINISGTVTDTVDGVDTNSTLTVSGKGYNFTGNVDLSGLTLTSGTEISVGGSQTTVGTLTNKGGIITVANDKQLIVSGALVLDGGTSQLSGSLKAADLTVSNGGKLTMATGSVLDLTGKFADMSGQDNKLNNLLTTLQSVTTNGTSYVLVKGTQGDKDYSMQHDMTIADNMVLDGHLTLNGRGWDSGHSNGHKLLVSDASLKVGKDGAGALTLATKATLEIASGSFEAGAATLGYIGDGGGGNYGAINITGGAVKLQSVKFGGGWTGNAVTMTAGKLEFTGEGAVFTGNNNDAVGSVSISGGEVVVNEDQSMDTVASKRSVSLSNMSFNIAENKSMALDTGVTVSGDVTVKGKGTLKFAGANNLSALSGTVKVTEAAKLQYMSDAVSVAAKGATGAAVSASAIQDAVVTVGGTADVSISQILSDSSLAYNGTSNLGIAGDGHTLTGVAAGNGSISFSGNAGIVNSEGSALASMSNVTISKLDIATAADKTIQVSGNSSTAAGQMSGLLALEEGASLKLSNVTMSESSMVQGYSAPMAVMAVDAGGNIAAAGNSVTLENTTVKLGATVPAVVQATAGNVIAPSVPTEIGASAKVYTFTSDIFNGVALNATGENALNVELSSVLTDALYGKGYDYVALSFENSTIVPGSENGINVTFEDETLKHLDPSVFLADNTIYIAIDQIPEPATATLSLLALAALAARRRRK